MDPLSRVRCTQPLRVTCLCLSERRSSPHVCVLCIIKKLEFKFSEGCSSSFYSSYLRYMRCWMYLVVLCVTACSNGWNPDQELAMKHDCLDEIASAFPDDAEQVCNCYMERLKRDFPEGKPTQEELDTAFSACIAPLKERTLEDFNQAIQDTLNH